MSINRKMEVYILQKNQEKTSLSGALKYSWETVDYISVAVFKKSDAVVVDSARYKECTHVGYTHCRDIDSHTYRLVNGKKIYEILSCNTESRLTALLLKEVGNVR